MEIQYLSDQQQKIQLKTFTNWINHTLKKNGSSRRVTDILEEVKDGVILLEIIQILTKEKVVWTKGRPSSTKRPLQINNVSTALDFLSTKGIRLVNINCSDIVDGKPAIVLGLIWKIILHLQVRIVHRKTLIGTTVDLDINQIGIDRFLWNHDPSTLITSRNTVLDAKDFGRSWRNGVLFSKLINTIQPGLVDTDVMVKENNQRNLQMAFNIAEEKLDIPRLLDPEDIDVDKPDEVSIITYVGEFIKKYPQGVDGTLKVELYRLILTFILYYTILLY
ncbi:hypothetical protein LOTGIDRAFT_130126 [Lottia gigantea]|uniref:Calponin-homology (CH) domain-containing protein n=1 Tax=Lottia gigantea TaxID=225164 RepID=V3ZNQ4_LOTGI|nr:hypothetical protein LOTGIDRAFT_130126 [Lottia gigantea]ESO85937.1 hypothetical protein LOTGIDRAFT_130126 [Lottia gigantea]